MSRIAATALLPAFVLACSPVAADENVADASSPQEADWSTNNLGATVNSPYHDAFPTISRDGLVLYFASDRSSYSEGDSVRPWLRADFDIYVTRRESLSAPWETPQRLPSHINTEGSEHSVSISRDGHWLYFSSDSLPGCGSLDIFRAYREDPNDPMGWGEPENLGCEVNSPAVDACVIYYETEAGATSLFFVSNRAGGVASPPDVYESRLDPGTGRFGAPVLLETVTSSGFDGHFDPYHGFVWSDRGGEGLGRGDIWLSRQGDSGQWQSPVNMGPAINTAYDEQMPSPFDDGRVLYFPSDRPEGFGGLDLYVSERS